MCYASRGPDWQAARTTAGRERSSGLNGPLAPRRASRVADESPFETHGSPRCLACLRGRVVYGEVAFDAELFERHVLRRVEHGERGEERELQVVALEPQRERRLTGNREVGLTPTLRHVGILEERAQQRSDAGVVRPRERLAVQARREDASDTLPVDDERRTRRGSNSMANTFGRAGIAVGSATSRAKVRAAPWLVRRI